MTISSEKVKEAKAALKTMSKRSEERLTKADFVKSLISEIHAKMEAGFSIEEICIELNKTLPETAQIKMNTFRTYVRQAREEMGIKPTRTWTRRRKEGSKDIIKDMENVKEKAIKEKQIIIEESEFRDQRGEV